MDEEQILRTLDFDYVIKDGKVYLNAEEFAKLLHETSILLAARAVTMGDVPAGLIAPGMMRVAGMFSEVSGEALRREATAILHKDFMDETPGS